MDRADEGRPLLVIVSGAPGAGKTTFARRLADQMCLLHIERDRIFRSLEYTAGRQIDREAVGIPLFYEMVSNILKANISLIIDCTLYKGKSEKDMLSIVPLADAVNIHCRSTDTFDRFYKRVTGQAGTVPPWLEEHMRHLKRIYPDVVDPLEFGCDVVEVNTTGEYSPTIDALIDKLNARSPVRSKPAGAKPSTAFRSNLLK
jgi:hypothetical protein